MRWIFIAVFLILAAASTGAMEGIGMSPACYGNDPGGNCVTINVTPNQTLEYLFRVYNFDNETKEFGMILEADDSIRNRTSFEPESFSLDMHNRQDCESSPGCQPITVRINVTDLANGTHTVYFSASTTTKGGGAMNINQVLKSKIMLYVLPPEKNSNVIYLAGAIVFVIVLLSILALFHNKNKKKSGKGAEKKLKKEEKKEKVSKKEENEG